MLQKTTVCLLCGLLLAAGSVFAQSEDSLTSSDIQAYRDDFSRFCDSLDMQFSWINSPHGHNLVLAARKSMESLTDEDISQAFTETGLPDLAPALAAVEEILSITPPEPLGLASSSTAFPGAPPVYGACDSILHNPGFRYGATIAWQVARDVLAGAEMGCLQVVVVLGEGGNTALACIPIALALAAAEIPVDLGEFCADEETAMTVLGNFDRLSHIHSDLETTKDTIIQNDNANRDVIVAELRSLGCEIVRILNTPEGLRTSDILSCQGQPSFPYDWPGKKDDDD